MSKHLLLAPLVESYFRRRLRNGLEKDPPEQDKTPFADGVDSAAAR